MAKVVIPEERQALHFLSKDSHILFVLILDGSKFDETSNVTGLNSLRKKKHHFYGEHVRGFFLVGNVDQSANGRTIHCLISTM